MTVTSVLSAMVQDGVFDFNMDGDHDPSHVGERDKGSTNRTVRSILVNGQLLSSAADHPKTLDGHHYDYRMANGIYSRHGKRSLQTKTTDL